MGASLLQGLHSCCKVSPTKIPPTQVGAPGSPWITRVDSHFAVGTGSFYFQHPHCCKGWTITFWRGLGEEFFLRQVFSLCCCLGSCHLPVDNFFSMQNTILGFFAFANILRIFHPL